MGALHAACLKSAADGPRAGRYTDFSGPRGRLQKLPIFSFSWKCTKMVSKWSKTVPKHIFMACCPVFGHCRFPPLHFGAPEAIWGSKMAQNGPKGGQKVPKMAPKGAKNILKWPKVAQNGQHLDFFRFSVSTGNALKWHPTGLNGHKTHCYGLLTPC